MVQMETIILNELRERFTESRWRPSAMELSQDGLDRMKRRLSDLPSETVFFLGDVYNDSSITDKDHALGSLLVYMLGESESTYQDIEDVAFLYLHSNESERVEIADGMPRSSTHPIPSPMLRQVLTGLLRYDIDGFNYDSTKSLRNNDKHTMRQCIALVNVARRLRSINSGFRIIALSDPLLIEDTAFAQLVADFPNDTELVLSLISERGLDAEVIREVMASENRALSEGII